MTKTKLTPRQINAARKRVGDPALNFRLFRKVITKLETTPEAYDQGSYGEPSELAPCGTAACIAGWAAHLSGEMTLLQLHENWTEVQETAQRELGIDDHELSVLFAGTPARKWPRRFAGQWMRSNTSKQRARVAIRYLSHIINTGKVTE